MTNDDGQADALLATQMEELRHRLRNHLQNMISLMSLQIRRARNAETIAALEDLRARFATLTSIYIDLDDSSDRPIELDKFVPDLVRRIGELYDPARRAQRGMQRRARWRCRASAPRSSGRSWSSW